jgi:hypothetical protein
MAQIRDDISTTRRIYVQTAYGEPCVADLKALGAHWDAERRCWWLGNAKRPAVEALLAAAVSAPPAPPEKEDASRIRLAGKARYKGRTYYVRFVGETKRGYSCRLITLDQSIDFWAACAHPGEVAAEGQAEIIKTYSPREYRGRTEYTTLGSIQRFIAQQRDPETRRGECCECGAYGPAGEPCSECGGEGSYV